MVYLASQGKKKKNLFTIKETSLLGDRLSWCGVCIETPFFTLYMLYTSKIKVWKDLLWFMVLLLGISLKNLISG